MTDSHLQGAGLDPSAVEDAALLGDAVALTQLLVATPSVNPELEAGGAAEREAAHLAAGWLEAWGAETTLAEVAPGRWNVVARLGARSSGRPARRLLLNGHLDTVGVAGMTIQPFQPEIRDGLLHGRGACDMKGGVGAILAATARLAREWEEHPPAGELVVALTADEEFASVGLEALVESGLQADFAVVCEPTSLAVMPAHKGFLWVELLARGRAAHGSRPQEGVDAILHMGRVLRGLDELDGLLASRPPHPLLGRASLHAGTIQGGTTPSVYPAECRLRVERRTLPQEEVGEVLDEFREMLAAILNRNPGMDVSLDPGLFRPGTEVALDDPGVRALASTCRELGWEPEFEGMSAWVDGALLNLSGTPAVCFGPGSLSQAHGAVEWVPVEEVERCSLALEKLARDFLR